jgi:hypothetical protein
MATAVSPTSSPASQAQATAQHPRTLDTQERTSPPPRQRVNWLDWWTLKLWLAGFAILAIMHVVEILARAFRSWFGT